MTGKKTGPPPVAQDKLTASGTDTICAHIVDGMSYREIARKYQVGLATLFAWLENPERAHACARARESASHAFDEKAEEDIENAEDAFQLAKARELAIHRRWRAKAVNPRRYGEKVQTEHSGEIAMSGVTDEELDRRIAEKLAAKA